MTAGWEGSWEARAEKRGRLGSEEAILRETCGRSRRIAAVLLVLRNAERAGQMRREEGMPRRREGGEEKNFRGIGLEID